MTNGTDYLGKKVTVKVDRPLGSKHPKHDMVYELNYGFIPGTMSQDGEELDAYVIGLSNPVDECTGICVAMIRRMNDADDKLIVVTDDKKNVSDDEIRAATHFQEQYFSSIIIMRP